MSLINKQVVMTRLLRAMRMPTITRRIYSIRKTSISIEVCCRYMEAIMIKQFKIWSNVQISCIKIKFYIPRTNSQIKILKMDTSHRLGKETSTDKMTTI